METEFNELKFWKDYRADQAAHKEFQKEKIWVKVQVLLEGFRHSGEAIEVGPDLKIERLTPYSARLAKGMARRLRRVPVCKFFEALYPHAGIEADALSTMCPWLV